MSKATILLLLWLSQASSFTIHHYFVVLGCTPSTGNGPVANRVALMRAGSSSNDDDDTNSNTPARNGIRGLEGILEGFVREITGEADYRLGDLGDKTKAGTTMSGSNETPVYQYQFGDITKSIVAEITKPNNNNNETTPARQPTSLLPWRNTLREKDLPLEMLEAAFSRLDKNQRINLILAMCQLAAEAVVLWGLATNLCTIITASLSWTWTFHAMHPGAMPGFEKDIIWRTFISKFTGLDLVLGPFFLIAKAIVTLVGFRRFHSFVHRLSTTSLVTKGNLQRYNSHVLNKAVAVILAFFITNIIGTAMLAALTYSLIKICFQGCR
jgi:hypothetical protein